MIDEIRVMSRTGANIFSGKIDLEKTEVTMADTDVLFAGFISAILSVSEELQNSDIRELGYQENKIIFTLTDNLIFLGFVDTRVPNTDVQDLLDVVIRKWMEEYDDMEYPFVPDEMRQKILKLVQESIKDVFWWASPTYSFSNNVKLVKTLFTKPGSTYYVQYLPQVFLLTGILMFLIPTALAYLLDVVFSGFGGGVPSSSNLRAFYGSMVTLGLFTLGTAALMKIMFRDQISVVPMLTISGIYSLLFVPVILALSGEYRSEIYARVFDAIEGNLLLEYGTEMFLFFAPLNIGFFGYIILVAYSGSNNSNISTVNFLVGYLLAALFVISIAQFIVIGVMAISAV